MKPIDRQSNTTHKRKSKREACPIAKSAKVTQNNPWSEVYCTPDYCKLNNDDEIYGKASTAEELFNDKSPMPRYARKKRTLPDGTQQDIEYAPKSQFSLLKAPPMNLTTGEIVPVEDDEYEIDPNTGQPMYPKDISGNEVYRKDKNGDDRVIWITLPKKQGGGTYKTQIYAKDKVANEKYPKRASGDEFAIRVDEAVPDLKYATDKNSNEFYPKKTDGSEEAQTGDYAKDHASNQIYPKNKDGDEQMIEINGRKAYVKDARDNEMYPKDKDGNESYLQEGSEEHPAKRADATGKKVEYYAKHSNGEFYPKKYMEKEEDLLEYLYDQRQKIVEKLK